MEKFKLTNLRELSINEQCNLNGGSNVSFCDVEECDCTCTCKCNPKNTSQSVSDSNGNTYAKSTYAAEEREAMQKA